MTTTAAEQVATADNATVGAATSATAGQGKVLTELSLPRGNDPKVSVVSHPSRHDENFAQ